MTAEPLESSEDALPARSILSRLADIGAAAQASVPALYAWSVTVAPAAFGRGAPLLARIAGVAGVVAIAAAVLMERRRSPYARVVLVWGLPLASVTVWLAASAMLSPLRVDTPRGVTGVVGWLLFALAAGGPALGDAARAEGRAVAGTTLAPRTPVRRGDVIYIGGAVAVAALLQAIGWQIVSPERALLVRLVTLASGIAIIGASTSVALARHAPRTAPGPLRRRLRAALPWLSFLVLLGILAAVARVR